MKRNKSKTNRYGKTLGLAVICGQVFREKPKKRKMMTFGKKETDGMPGIN